MPRNWFTYDIRAEGKDGALGPVLLTMATKRRALSAARDLARQTLALDDAAIVVMQRPEGGDRWDDKVIAAFPFAQAGVV